MSQAALDAATGTHELGYAESNVAQTGITTVTDVTSLSITFTVTTKPVYVEVLLPEVFSSTSALGGAVYITDAANAIKSAAYYSWTATALSAILVVRERISTPGTYTRKVRVARSSGSGALNVNLDANNFASIRAIET